jgi:hypothetical protein
MKPPITLASVGNDLRSMRMAVISTNAGGVPLLTGAQVGSAVGVPISPGNSVNVVGSGSVAVAVQANRATVSLVGDVSAPGDLFYYGTNAAGAKGWYLISAALPVIYPDLFYLQATV